MKSSFILFFLLLISFTAKSQLIVKNKGGAPISFCIGYYMESDTFAGWITEGWYTVRPNEMKCIICYKLNSYYYYYYAITKDSLRKEYSGNYTMRIRTQPFKIVNANKILIFKA